MATLDSLPGDQRAVLQLVLGRGRSFDQIAGLLHIDREAVRARALAALDTLGPQTRVATAERQRICDYLLGQLPEAEVPEVRDRLAHGAAERAWARVLSGELAAVASGPLPEIPSDGGATSEPIAASAEPAEPAEPVQAAGEPAAPPADDAAESAQDPPAPPPPLSAGTAPPAATKPRRGRRSRAEKPASPSPPTDGDGQRPRSSRRGGFVLIALAAVVIVVVVLVLVLHGSSKPSHTAAAPVGTATPTSSTLATGTGTAPAGTATTPPGTGTSTGAGTSPAAASGTTSAQPSVQINLTPAQPGSKAEGIADVLKEGNQQELAIVAQGLIPNTSKNSYEVWLYNSRSDAEKIGFGPTVGANGKLAAAGPWPADASHFKQLVVTLETAEAPKTPGTIVMQGQVTGLS